MKFLRITLSSTEHTYIRKTMVEAVQLTTFEKHSVVSLWVSPQINFNIDFDNEESALKEMKRILSELENDD